MESALTISNDDVYRIRRVTFRDLCGFENVVNPKPRQIFNTGGKESFSVDCLPDTLLIRQTMILTKAEKSVRRPGLYIKGAYFRNVTNEISEDLKSGAFVLGTLKGWDDKGNRLIAGDRVQIENGPSGYVAVITRQMHIWVCICPIGTNIKEWCNFNTYRLPADIVTKA